MRQYAQEIGDRFVAALAHSYGDAYTFLRCRSNVARWSPEHIVVLRDRVEHAYQEGRISADTLDKACKLIASLVGDYDDPKTDEIAPAPRPAATVQARQVTTSAKRVDKPSSVATLVRNPPLTIDAVARHVAPETVLLADGANPAASWSSATTTPRNAPSVRAVTASPCKIVAGSTLGQRYLLERLVGIGGTALVYQARDLMADGARAEQRLAVKLLHPVLQARPQAVERFVHQFRQQQKLSHPGIARVFDLDVDGGNWFMTMELLEGETLLDRLRHGLSRSEALRLMAACGDALGYAHRCGVVHGDLKPSNIFLTLSGTVRLLDFGGTVEQRSTAAAGGAEGVAATPAYASPEVLAGERPAVRDDVFSLACIAHELLTGQHRDARAGAQAAPTRPVSSELTLRDSLALSRGMAWQRLDRPETVAEFLRLLLAPQPTISVPERVSGPADTAAETLRTRWQRHWRLLGFGVWGVGCLMALLSFSFDDSKPLRQAEAPSAAAVTVPETEAPVEAAPSAVTPSATVPLPAAPAPETPPATTITWVPDEPAAAPPPSTKPSARSAASSPRRAPAARVLPASIPPVTNAAGSIGLANRQVLVSGRAVAAVITLKRTGGTNGRARVRWSTVSGTAKSAQDYRPTSAIAEFADGQEIRTLFVPIMQQRTERSARTFSVALERAPGGPPVGPVTRTSVIILGDS